VDYDEPSLVERARRGDPAAFEALVNQHAVYVYNLAFRVAQDAQEAEDLAQETFLRAWQGLAHFRGQARFATWLYRIQANLFYNRWPRLRRDLASLPVEAAAFEPIPAEQGVEAAVVSAEERAAVHAAIDRLSPAYRVLITLRHLQEMSYEEIAQTLNLPLGTVKTGIHRARRELQQALAPLASAARTPLALQEVERG
jgi:RNA polymerase sigma-70 factor (ECF subfamily)